MTGRRRAAVDEELKRAREAEVSGTPAAAWSHLERAHVLSQPFAFPHVRVHLAMFAFAWHHHLWHELVGQLPRLLLAGPASALGRAPIGNTGGSNVSLFRPLPVPADLQALLDER